MEIIFFNSVEFPKVTCLVKLPIEILLCKLKNLYHYSSFLEAGGGGVVQDCRFQLRRYARYS